jgi:hypothetical protein
MGVAAIGCGLLVLIASANLNLVPRGAAHCVDRLPLLCHLPDPLSGARPHPRGAYEDGRVDPRNGLADFYRLGLARFCGNRLTGSGSTWWP